MARRPGFREIHLERMSDILFKERRENKDVYLPFRPPSVRLEINDSLAPGPERYRLVAHTGEGDIGLRFTPTSFRQLCSLASIPAPLLARAPAALGLNLLRSMLEMSEAGEGMPFLLRMRLSRRPVLRAILPQSFVRMDDLRIAEALTRAAGDKEVRASSLSVDEDTWFTRLLIGDRINLGGAITPDEVVSGVDLITSETGVHPLEVRHVLFRVVCSNGMTRPVEKQPSWQSRYTSMDRSALEGRLADALDRAFGRGREMAGCLSESRAGYVDDAAEEIERIFRRYRLGNPRGKIGEWISSELLKNVTLFGVSRWTICQAFTAVARGLDHAQRMRFEDAMGSYLLKGTEKEKSRDH